LGHYFGATYIMQVIDNDDERMWKVKHQDNLHSLRIEFATTIRNPTINVCNKLFVLRNQVEGRCLIVIYWHVLIFFCFLVGQYCYYFCERIMSFVEICNWSADK
jgi:hypothetical protein